MLTNEQLRTRMTQRIRKEIDDRELKYRAVADAIGISHSSMTQMLAGCQFPSMHTLYKLAMYLDMFVDQFFFDDLDKEGE